MDYTVRFAAQWVAEAAAGRHRQRGKGGPSMYVGTWKVEQSREFFRLSGCDVSQWSDELVQDTLQWLLTYTTLNQRAIEQEYRLREERRKGHEYVKRLRELVERINSGTPNPPMVEE